MDETIIIILPPIITAVLAWIAAMRKSKLDQVKLISQIHTQAYTLIQQSEASIRQELREEIHKLKSENVELNRQVDKLRDQLTISDNLVETLREEISTLREKNAAFETEIAMLRGKKNNKNLHS